MYGPVSKDGPSMEFGEVGEEIKDEARRSLEPRSRRLILSGAKRTRNT